jgi:citrate lyase subunit beta/citryl-CoA lyase
VKEGSAPVKFHRPIRSKLFVPGSRPELFVKATASAADALSFDLEDAVVAERKGEARARVAEFLGSEQVAGDKVNIVRVNGLASEHFEADVEALVTTQVDIINVPKVESREDVLRAVDAVRAAEKAAGVSREIGLLVNIETPKGLRLAFEIAMADERVMGLQLGFTDFSLACGIASTNKVALNAVRVAMCFAGAEAGIACYDGAFVDVKNTEGFRAEAEEAKALGFAGKSCIHPSQITLANAAFSPSAVEIERARGVLAAAEEASARGVGAFLHDGKMVDSPVIARAQAVVALAERVGGL